MSSERNAPSAPSIRPRSLTDRVILYCLENRLVVGVFLVAAILTGLICAPFDWKLGGLPRSPVPVDAIPDIGENQQIVWVDWPGRSPRDVEDQVTYPLTTALLGLPGVKSVRANSMFGFSTVYVIFRDDVEFYFSRSRILEKLSSLPSGLLPEGARPQLGPDATALGQIFWYTIEGRDSKGRPTGGWDPHELRRVQDFIVRQALQSVEGVAECASVGGYAREYQVDVDPNRMRAAGVTLEEVAKAVRNSNIDVGARTLEINRVEYFIRGLGFIKSLDDLRNVMVKNREGIPVLLADVATVTFGPQQRAGALDRLDKPLGPEGPAQGTGGEAVGGVVAARFGENPRQVIANVKARVAEIAPGLPSKTLPDGTVSQATITPFYDRAGLIDETLHTLHDALADQALVTVIVVLVMVGRLGGSLVVSLMMPLAILISFAAMRGFRVDANIVALSGIAISIGEIVDMCVILLENVFQQVDEGTDEKTLKAKVFAAASEVGSAIFTSTASLVVSFLPVLLMTGPEGKLFKPLAYAKCIALAASFLVALVVIPTAAVYLLKRRKKTDGSGAGRKAPTLLLDGLIAAGLASMVFWRLDAGVLLAGLGLWGRFGRGLSDRVSPEARAQLRNRVRTWTNVGVVLLAWVLLTMHWEPLGPEKGLLRNLIFSLGVVGGWLLLFHLFHGRYARILEWCLANKRTFLAAPAVLTLLGGLVWMGARPLLSPLPNLVKNSAPARALVAAFPGVSKEFMPPLDEGSFLFMPSTMPHASVPEALDILRKQDAAIAALPEVATVVGKLGRAESPLDPAPVSMSETVVHYRPEHLRDEDGRLLRFKFDGSRNDLARDVFGVPVAAPDGKGYIVPGAFERTDDNRLIPDDDGQPFRLWRPALDPALNPGRAAWPGVNSPDDVWRELAAVARIPGATAAPKLQPISARLVMLSSGIRAAMAVKLKGPSLEAIEQAAQGVERTLRNLPTVDPQTVIAERLVAKPYLEIELDRKALAAYGLDVQTVQDVIETAIGGRTMTTTVEGRERYPVRLRYARELRDSPEALGRVMVDLPEIPGPAPTLTGVTRPPAQPESPARVPLAQLATIRTTPGPMVIKTEDAFLVGYVLFDMRPGFTEVDAAQEVQQAVKGRVETGDVRLPPGVSWSLAGTWENQVRSERRLMIILPLTLGLIFLIIYLQFRSASVSALVFSSVAVAWAGGFILIWLYGQDWFMNLDFFGKNLREIFQMGRVNLSLAVWVGFLALFGVAANDGVVMATYLEDLFRARKPADVATLRGTVVEAGLRRVRPCLMTTATTILALIPALTSRGRGADLLVPMAIPTFGGMIFVMITMFIVPTLYCWLQERRLARFGVASAVASDL